MMQRGRNGFVSGDRAAVAVLEPGKHGQTYGNLAVT